MIKKLYLIPLILLAGITVISSTGYPVTSTITDLGTLGSTASPSRAFAVNENGQVAGWSYLSNTYYQHAFIWSGGIMTDLGVVFGPANSRSSRAYSLNDSGLVVGRSNSNITVDHACLWYSPTSKIDLGTFAPNNVGTSEANDINNNGHVVGWAWTGTTYQGEYTYHAFFWVAGQGKTDLGTFGGSHSYAQAINSLDRVVGWAYTAAGAVRSFLWDEVSGMVEIPNTLGGTSSQAYDINDSSWVVGYARNASNQIIPYLWRSGTGMIDLGLDVGVARAVNNKGWVVGDNLSYADPYLWKDGSVMYLNDLLPAGSGWVLATAEDINENGQIVGYGTINGQSHAYLLTLSGLDEDEGEDEVIPEPASLLLLGLGVTGLGLFKRIKK